MNEENVFSPIIASIIRHLLTAVASILVAGGYIAESQSPEVVGAIMMLLAFGWSIYQKISANKKLKLAIAAPAGKASPTGTDPKDTAGS
jgi:hypothetical protein